MIGIRSGNKSVREDTEKSKGGSVSRKYSTIVVRTEFEGVHAYLAAPEEVAYLRNVHRHKFYVEAEISVDHDDRELEFLMVKHYVDGMLKRTSFPVTVSCEQIAGRIGDSLIKKYGNRRMIVSVFEDNENGGRVYYGGEE